MIYTIDTFQVHPRHYAEFLQLSEQEVWPDLEARGAMPLGLWEVVLGGPRRLFLLTRYDDVGHWGNARDWPSLNDEGKGRAALVENSDALVMRPITATQPGSAPETEPGIYTLRTFRIDMKDLDQFIDLSENKWWPWVRLGEGVRPICQWTTVIAEQARIYMMTRYDNLAHWEGHQKGSERQTLDDPELKEIYEAAVEAIEERGKIVKETSVKILRPISDRRP